MVRGTRAYNAVMPSRTRSLSIAALILVGCAPRAAPPVHAARPSIKAAVQKPGAPKTCTATPAATKPSSPRPYVNTGDPVPKPPPPHNTACPDQRASAARWVDSDPHTPFFVTDDRGIHDRVGACCTEWAVPKFQWRTIDAYGRVVGHAKLVGGEGYDLTQCYELEYKQLTGSAGVGLYVSATGAWKPAKQNARWVPSASERSSLARFVADAGRILADDLPPQVKDRPLPLDQRVLYFQLDRGLYEPEGKFEHYAVVGGRFLVIARLDAKGRWVAKHLETDITNYSLYAVRAYRPLAVFDVNGDGVPEVIFHSNAGDGWSDSLLQVDDNGVNWSIVAESVGGSTA